MSGRASILVSLIAILTCCSNNSSGREFPTIHFTLNDGLPSNTVYNIYRSHDGFLWIATDKGVARYNGIRFEKFTTFDGLADNEIFFSQEDLQGRIWFGTYNGQLCFYKDGFFHNASNTPWLKLPFKQPFIRQINIEKDSSVSIFFTGDAFVNIKNEKCEVIDAKKAISLILPFGFVYCRKQSATTYKIKTFNRTVVFDTRQHIIGYEEQGGTSNIYFRTFLQDQVYIVRYNCIYDTSLNLVHRLPEDFCQNRLIIQVYKADSTLFVTTDKGLFMNDSIELLQGNRVSCINRDMNGNYWASTLNNGLFLIDKDFARTSVSQHAYGGQATYVFKDKNHLLFATDDHTVYEFVKDKARKLMDFSYLLPKDWNSVNTAYYIDSSYHCYNFYNYQVIAVDNILAKSLKVRTYKTPYFLGSSTRQAIAVGKTAYVNARNRVWKITFDEPPKRGAAFKEAINDTMSQARIFDMDKDPQNFIWFSTADKMYKVIDDKAIEQKQFNNVAFKSFKFWNRYLIGYTQNNQLAVCENVNGNIKIDFVRPQNCIWDELYPIDNSHFVISTNNLYRLITVFADSNRKYTITPIENPFIPFKAEEAVSDGDNCYFLKDGAITCIPISDFLIKPRSPQLFLKFLRTNKNVYPIKNQMAVDYDESKNIVISFSTLSFGGRHVLYQYSISKDETENWRELTGEELNLVNPGYGNYKVKIRAKTITSSFAAPISFRLHILKPFWAEWWFIAPFGIALITIIGVGVRMRTRTLLREQEKEHDTQIKFMKSEYKALNALMNPHFIFNTLNNVQGLVNRNDKLAANEYLRIFADLVRQNMHNISKELISLQQEMELVSNYLQLERLRFKEKLTYSIEVDEAIDLSDILIPPLLVQPLVENSIKHGILPLETREGFVQIKVYQQQNHFCIEIRDNGVGMAKSMRQKKLYSSFGLENVRKRLDQLSIMQDKKFELKIEEIKDPDQPHLWTVVTIMLPADD